MCFINECTEASEPLCCCCVFLVFFFLRDQGDFQFHLFCGAIGYEDEVRCVRLNSAIVVIRPADGQRQTSLMQQHTWKGQLSCPAVWLCCNIRTGTLSLSPSHTSIQCQTHTHTHTHTRSLSSMPRRWFVVTLQGSRCQEAEWHLPAVVPPVWPGKRPVYAS